MRLFIAVFQKKVVSFYRFQFKIVYRYFRGKKYRSIPPDSSAVIEKRNRFDPHNRKSVANASSRPNDSRSPYIHKEKKSNSKTLVVGDNDGKIDIKNNKKKPKNF